jgi:ribosomal protein S27AE
MTRRAVPPRKESCAPIFRRNAMQCPNPTCSSTDIVSNHLPERWMENVAHASHLGHRVHSPILTFGGTALWCAMKAVNSLRRAWRCNRCGSTFDA